MNALIVTAIRREWVGFRTYWEHAVATSPLNEFVDPPFAPSKPLTYTFTPPPCDTLLVNEDEIVEFERVATDWMFGRE